MEITKWIIMAFAYGMVAGMLITFLALKLGLKRQKREDKIFRKLELKLCGFDEEECAKHHLPGDCPLCGAR